MNAIPEMISLMNEEDKKDFNAFLRKKNKRDDVKNIRLFKMIETDDIIGEKKLYKGQNNNDAYHALRKRLHDSLVQFMANRTFENATGEAHDVLRLLVVSRFFLEHSLTKTAFKCLAKAEARALPLEQFSLLNEIYLTRIQYAHLNPAEDLHGLMEKFRNNQVQMQREAQLNIGYALLRRELHDIHLKGKVVDFRTFVMGTIKQLGVSLNEVLTYKSLYQMLFIANEYATMNHNFTLVEPFVKRSYEFIEAKKDSGDGQLFYHIYIIYFLANINFRNHRFDESQSYLARMAALMQRQGSRYHSRFHLRHQLLTALNLHFSGKAKEALAIAEKALKSAGKKADPHDVNDLRACITMFLVQHRDKASVKYMAQFTHTDAWYEKKLGMLWTIRKALLEILLHAQFENEELALARLKSFKRRYKKYLEQVNEQRVMEFALMVERSILRPEIVQHPDFKSGILSIMNPAIKEDIFVISFLGWLIAQAEKKTPYEAALELVNR
nr:hypothetical protein [uncultured Flavobacterium sp.]